MEICTNLEKLFLDTLGLNTATIGRAGLERIIQAAMRRSGVADAAAYLELLSASPEEFEQCLEELVVPETWFFRDQEPFSLLKQHLCGQFSSHPDQRVRILSVPCSTGEEPYSIAMTLLAAGIEPGMFQLDAVDISRRGLAAACRAVYGKTAFRQPLTAVQEAFFTGPPGTRRLDDQVVRAVHFYRANLIDPLFLAGQALYHIIFCRNILIYLTEEARSLVFTNIDRLLAPEGILFTGHAEMGLLLQQGYRAVNHARSFACRRAGESAPPGKSSQISPLPQPVTVNRRDCATFLPEPSPARETFSRAAVPTMAPPLPLPPAAVVGALHAQAKALADRGLFDEAAALCRRYLREQHPQADVYCLLGLIHEAARQPQEAEDCYERALYLNPDHYETLIHLSLLYRRQGDGRRAARYRRRAEATEGRPNGTIGP